MTMEIELEDEIFEVGLPISLETYYKDYLTTQVRGWDEGAFILTRGACMEGKPAPLYSHDKCNMRFLRHGIAYGFQTEILSIQFFPSPLIFLKYPKNIESMKLRQFDRIRTKIPAQLSDLKGAFTTETTILDISEGGCGAKVHFCEGLELSPEEAVIMNFTVMETKMKVRCQIRKIKKTEEAYILGLEFIGISAAEKETLNSAINFLRKYLPL